MLVLQCRRVPHCRHHHLPSRRWCRGRCLLSHATFADEVGRDERLELNWFDSISDHCLQPMYYNHDCIAETSLLHMYIAEACRENDIETINLLLYKSNVHVDNQAGAGHTLLHSACSMFIWTHRNNENIVVRIHPH